MNSLKEVFNVSLATIIVVRDYMRNHFMTLADSSIILKQKTAKKIEKKTSHNTQHGELALTIFQVHFIYKIFTVESDAGSDQLPAYIKLGEMNTALAQLLTPK